MSKPRKKTRARKRILVLPDLEQSKAAVLNSLTSKSGQRSYDRPITDFVEWYCSEPRLAFNRTIVLRYRIFLGSAHGFYRLELSFPGSRPQRSIMLRGNCELSKSSQGETRIRERLARLRKGMLRHDRVGLEVLPAKGETLRL